MEKYKEYEKAREKQLEEIRKERSSELDDFVRKSEWKESKAKLWEEHKIVRTVLCALCEL